MKNKYCSAMEKIIVTPQMEERILGNVACKMEQGIEAKKRPYPGWAKPVASIAACCAILLGTLVIYFSYMNSNWGYQPAKPPQLAENSEGTAARPELVSNPIINTKGVDELKKAVPFELSVPEKLPAGYKIDSTSVIAGKLAQIVYSDGSNEIIYRTVKGTEDISGDYSSYSESNVAEIGNTKVTLKGSKALINLATWIKDDCSYSLSFSAGAEKDDVVSIIKSMKKA